MAVKPFRNNGARREVTLAGHETILFVDDNAALRHNVEQLLKLEGFAVLLADTGATALQVLAETDVLPDLILSDVAMPEMDGFELFEAVRSELAWIDIPFVFLTARDEEALWRRGYELGVDDYLVKPFDQERLLMVVRGKLKRRRDLKAYLETQRAAIECAQQELSAMVAHELRTPLTSISMVSEVLTRDIDHLDWEQVQDMLAIMRTGSVRLNRLIEQMVMYVELRSGALQSAIVERARPVAIDHVITGAVRQTLALDYQNRQPQFRYEGQKEALSIHGDRYALQHAFVELFMNAMMFSSPGSEITIIVSTHDHALEISIRDHGIGIAAQDQALVFEAFQQVDREKQEQQGIGIGLTLARGIVEVHGGSIVLDSVPGDGTLVIVRLPIGDAV